MLELFSYKKVIEKVAFIGKSYILRGMYVMSTNARRAFVIFHTKQVESGSKVLILSMYIMHIYRLTLPPTFAYHKPWLTESSGAHQQSQTMGECLFSFVSLVFFLNVYWSNQLSFCLVTSTLCMQVEGYLNLVWKITNPLLLPHELNRNTKQEYILKVLKVALK